MNHALIGLTGRMGSGKSLAATYLRQAYDYQNIKFAGALKDMVRCLGLTNEHIEGPLKEVPCDLLGGKTPRFAMQTIGTEWGRDTISPSLWIDVWKARVRVAGHVVVDDVRFPNEAEAVRSMGGILVRIERGEAPKPSHASEIMDFAADVNITNNGTIEEFLYKIGNLLVAKAA